MLIRLRFILYLALFAQVAMAQQSTRPLPPGLSFQYENTLKRASLPEPVLLPKPDLQKIKAEDDLQSEQNRFAAPVETFITPANSGKWTILPDSSSVWQCRIKSPDALALVVLFEHMHLPEGGKIYAYDPQQRRIRGAFDRLNETPTGRFTIGTIPGDEVVIEYHAPAYSRGQEDILINRVDYAYHYGALASGDAMAATSGFGGSSQCHVNVQCPEGANWQTEKKGVARILMVFASGSAWCSGSVMANSGGTGTPYFLTAHHCQIILTSPQFDQWTFDFNYEFPTCTNSTTEPPVQTVVGCERMSWRAETDFLLLKLNPIPGNYNVYYNGWSRSATPVANTTYIHHPVGDVKKISADNAPPVIHTATVNWGGVFGVSPVNTHWKVVPDVGIYEPGSSGCPLFGPDKKIIGQLHGGVATNCNVSAAYFGMFNLSWDQGSASNTRLKEWLDPGNTNATTQNGYSQPIQPVTISGNIKTWSGVNLPNVRVAISGAAIDTVTTDASGNFQFPDLTPGLNYVVKPLSKTNVLNGVNAFDLILTSRHILSLEPLGVWNLIAADVNESGTVTSFDIVESRKVLLGTLAGFSGQKTWRYFPANTTFPDPANPFPNLPASTATFQNVAQSVTGVNFFGVKIGDGDNSADPTGM